MIKGLGVDIVEHQRVNLKIAKKVLTKRELEIFANSKNQVEYLASRFAVKEAIIKASNKKYLLQDIEVSNDQDGRPLTNILDMQISLSHEHNYTVAVAIWEEHEK